MNYHRGHWKKWASLVSEVAPSVGVALELYEGVEQVTRPRMPYQPGGHPILKPTPWQFPGPPANEWRVADVVNRVNSLLMVPYEVPGLIQRMDELDRLLRSVPPVELDTILARLGPEGLTALDGVLATARGFDDSPWYFCRAQGFYNHLLESVGPYVVSLIGAYMYGCQPSVEGLENPPEGWILPAGPFVVFDNRAYRADGGYRVESSVAPMAWQDMRQGGLGDCWFLTSLQAVAKANPEFLPRHIRQNANGTVSVVLYHGDGGQACPITVTPDLPMRGGALLGAAGHTADPAYAELWPGYYEKAFAQFSGGYPEIEGGFASRAFPIITGRPVEEMDLSLPGALQEVENRMRHGQAIAVGTVGGGSDRESMLGGRLICSHEYFVKQVDLNTGRMCLGNPWGDGSTKQQWECWLSQYEVTNYLHGVWAVNPW